MNSVQFFFRRIAARFGVVSSRYYLRTATEENLMLKEAETLLGKFAWRDLENVEELTSEYWRIRQLDSEQIKVEEKITATKSEMEKVQEEAETPETLYSSQLEKILSMLENERTVLAGHLKALQAKIHDAELLRKKFNGLKLKLSVLKGENTSEQNLAEVRAELQNTKQDYADLTRNVENLRGEILLQEGMVSGIEHQESDLRSRLSHRERNITRNISDVSRRLIESNARMGVLESEKMELFSTIGRTLRVGVPSASASFNEVVQKFKPIIQRAKMLSQSIEYNRRLADYK